ncbi:MAG: ABC transporter substrate binding protein [Gammaproteobacteria bacterium]|nr:ABC transporter substrate binding protein [Gammaproteobacteria bacterium]
MKRFTLITASLLAFLLLSACNNNAPETRIGIIEPIEHTAMDEIVAGFKKTLAKNFDGPVAVHIENAEADPSLERAIIQKMRDAHYTMIVPIGVDATEMTLSMTKNIPVVSLASDLSDKARQKLNPCNVAAVHDEISSAQILSFIHQVYPHLKNLVLVHSSANKVFPEVQATIAAGKKFGITIHPMMVSTLAELYSVSQSLPTKTEGIFILKDSLIASGIATLANVATQKHIPLISSDQGSVQNGAGFALGVHESRIGEEGAILAAQILKGRSACELPIVDMKNLTVFVNGRALDKAAQSIKNIRAAAAHLHYPVEQLDS